MFSSIKWRFTVIYFVLIFIAMIISGMFIIKNLEIDQLDYIEKTLEDSAETFLYSSTYLSEDNWRENALGIQDTINTWRINRDEAIYIIDNSESPIIIASSVNASLYENIYTSKTIDPIIIEKAQNGEKATIEKLDLNTNHTFKHLAYPVFKNNGELKGIIYMTSDLQPVNQMLDNTIRVIINGILMALLFTLVLSFIIANSITEPIRNVTKKAELMAQGDFDQYVEVMSDDELGKLSTMFNYLTRKLKDTLDEMEFEKMKLDTMFEYMTEGVVAIQMDGTILHANPIAVDILGYDTLEESIGEIFPKVILDYENISEKNPKEDNKDKILMINGLVYKVNYAIFNNDATDLGGLIIVFQDTTREHKLDEIRKEFVANVSHELKTPLTNIKIYTETLMNSELDSETKNNFLTVIDKETDRMTNLVRDLLELSNIDYDKSRWNFKKYSLRSIVEDVIRKLNYSAKMKNQIINFVKGKTVPEMMIDVDAIERVIINIISNSIKYTEEKGKITVYLYTEDDFAVLKVKDNGIGIPKEDLERVFDRFYRVEKGRSREMGGTGLGLSIAKEIIEGHSGTISMDSTFGEGTETTIKLPIKVN